MIRRANRLANLLAIDSNLGMENTPIPCRPGCGACCIAPSITTAIPGMPDGKPAGMACIQLDEKFGCRIFGQACRPDFCAGLQPAQEMCGNTREEALVWLSQLELATRPDCI